MSGLVVSFGHLVLRQVLQLIVLGLGGERAKEIEILVLFGLDRSEHLVRKVGPWPPRAAGRIPTDELRGARFSAPDLPGR